MVLVQQTIFYYHPYRLFTVCSLPSALLYFSILNKASNYSSVRPPIINPSFIVLHSLLEVKSSNCVLSLILLQYSTRNQKQEKINLDPIQYGPFSDAQGRRSKKAPLPIICHAYHEMMKLGTAIPSLGIKKNMNHVTHPLKSADIDTFLTKISKFCYVKKYRYRLHFDT